MHRKLAENLKRIQERIGAACIRNRRPLQQVRLIAVTKTASIELIRELVELGVRDFGENRVSGLIRRAATFRQPQGSQGSGAEQEQFDGMGFKEADVAWHMIGHLQRNKVRMLLPWVAMIHSVDSLRLAEELDQGAEKLDRVLPILMEVNAGGEATKQGVAVAAATHLAEQIATLRHLDLRGLMCMAPLTRDQFVIRHTFERTRELFEEILSLRICGPSFRELSMGMSNDFELGIECGATMVRIGSLLFEGIELAPQPAEAD